MPSKTLDKPRLKVWQYDLPPVKGEGWAIIILREDGYFSTVSDYGNYAYKWSSIGCKDFREFLLASDNDWYYFAKKLKSDTHIDREASIKNILQELLKRRRRQETPKNATRRIFEVIRQYDDDWEGLIRSPDDALMREFPEPWNYTVRSLDSDVVGFCQIIFPRLNAILRKELGIT
jgi:hypothetical protein